MYLKIFLILIYFIKFSITNETLSYVGCYTRNIAHDNSVYSGNVHQCIDICENSMFRYAVLSSDKCSCANQLMEDSEKLDINICNIRCSKNKIQYCGGIDAESYYTTGLSGLPKQLQIINISNTSLEIEWLKVRKQDQVTSFLVKAYVIKTFSNEPIINQREWTLQKDENRYELIDLHPGTMYNISVQALCNLENCGTAYTSGETNIGVPDPMPIDPKIVNRTDTTMTIEILPGINNNGPITYYRLVVQIIDDVIQQEFDENLLVNYNQSLLDGVPYYITAEINFMNHTHDFHIGDSFIYRGFYNAPLPPKAHVNILLGVVSSWNGVTTIKYSKTTHDDYNLGVTFFDQEADQLPLIIACVIFGLLLVFSIVAYAVLRYRTRHRRQRLTDTHELTMQGPIVEMENGGFSPDELYKGNFKTQLNSLVDSLDSTQRFARNAIRLNIDNVLATGQYGEVLTGKLYKSIETYDCQVHVVSDDMENQDKGNFLKDFNQIIKIMPHEKFVEFLGVSASPDWFYVIFEMYPISLKKKLVESRLPHTTDDRRFSSLSEECIIQWIYDISVAMEYLEANKVNHKHLCSHNVYVTYNNQIKLSLFGPTPFVDFNKPLDISRWLAPEVLRFQHHSSKSDVWSFACLAWECCTLGATPFASITSQDLLPRIKNGTRPEQPNFIFGDLYQLFLNCWQMEPSERPDFEDIAFNIREILISPKHSLLFDRKFNMIIPYYLPLLEMQN